MERVMNFHVALLLLMSTCGLAGVHRVPLEYPTIQAAIDSSANGDVILVAPGTYIGDGNRDIDFRGKAITVKSEGGPRTCIIDCQGSTDEPHRGFLVYCEGDGNSIFDGLTVKNGYVLDAGGAIRCANGGIVKNCIIMSNTASDGGGIHISNGVVVNCVIACNVTSSLSNEHGKGGGIYASEGSPSIVNCTIVGNKASREGGGIACGYRGTTNMENCILVGNKAILGNQVSAFDAGMIIAAMKLKIKNCCVQSDSCADIWQNKCQPQFIGSSVLDEDNVIYTPDPHFVNPAEGDFRLHPNSPCVDSGTNVTSFELPGTDIEGNPRVSDGDRDGISLPDIGAHEVLVPDEPYIWISKPKLEFIATTNGPNPEPQVLTIQNLGSEASDWTIQNDCNWLHVQPDSGSYGPMPIEVVASADVSTMGPGKFTCSLIVSDEKALNSPQTIPVVLYLTKTLCVPSEFATIQEAIDAASPYDTVVIADGIYQEPGNRDITFRREPITIRSENGPDNCIVDAGIKAIDSGNASAFGNEKYNYFVLDGLTTKWIHCDQVNPTIQNCCISEGIYLVWSNALIENCVITDCEIGILYQSSNPIISGCKLEDNEIALLCDEGSSLHLHACDISGNRERAIYSISHRASEIVDCRINGNGGGPQHLGAVVSCCAASTITLEGCNVSGNRAGLSFVGCGRAVIENSVVSGNGRRDNSTVYAVYFNQGTLLIDNSTFVGNVCAGLYSRKSHWLPSDRVVITNSIFWGNEPNQIAGNTDLVTVTYSNIEDGWPGKGKNVDIDPYFADLGHWDPNGTADNPSDDFWVDGDYHLKSQAGRWEPTTQAWAMDDVTSPCIDSGDPNSPIGREPFPNGGRINMGAYGGTVEASKSYFGKPVCDTIIAGDINGDCRVDFKDFTLMASHWLEGE